MSTRTLIRHLLRPPRLDHQALHTTSLLAAQRLARRRAPIAVRRHPPPPASSSSSALAKQPDTDGSPTTPAMPPPSTPQVIEQETNLSPELPPASRLPVDVPHDAQGIIDRSSSNAAQKVKELFSVPAIVVSRQLEMMSIMIGYEQANKYQLQSPDGRVLGYLMEEDQGLGKAITRQMLRTHRPFKATVLDTEGNVILTVRRPFTWINSRIYVSLSAESEGEEGSNQDRVIGEAQQEWHIYRRRYNMFVNREGQGMDQFGKIDAGLLAWDFTVLNEEGTAMGSINRNFQGFAKELFADAGQYVLRFEGVVDELNAAGALPSPINDAALPSPASPPAAASTSMSGSPRSEPTGWPETSARSTAVTPMSSKSDDQKDSTTSPSLDLALLPSITYDQRAVMLASAISCDFDYFSRHSGHGGMMGPGMWMPMPMGGTSTTEAGAEDAGAEAGGVGMPGPSPEGDESVPGPTADTEDLPVNRDSGGWSEDPWSTDAGTNETMQDPWASQPEQSDGGSWSWSDLFPGDD